MISQPISSAIALAHRFEFVFVSTIQEEEGFPDTRVMFNLLKVRANVLADGPATLANPFSSWLGTNTSSQKLQHIRKIPRISLYYADTVTFEGLSVQGTAEEVLDQAIRAAIWMDEWERFYPGGRDGGDFTVLRFNPLRGRYYCGLQVVTFDTGSVR